MRERRKEKRLRKIMRKRKSKNAVEQKEVGHAKIELEWEMKKREKT